MGLITKLVRKLWVNASAFPMGPHDDLSEYLWMLWMTNPVTKSKITKLISWLRVSPYAASKRSLGSMTSVPHERRACTCEHLARRKGLDSPTLSLPHVPPPPRRWTFRGAQKFLVYLFFLASSKKKKMELTITGHCR